MSEPLRIGVLGAARISDRSIVPAAQQTGTRLVAVAARDRARAEAFAEQYGVERVLDSYTEVVTDAEVEAIYNPLANGLHAPWNLAAIAAGKHVLSEKPFASNAEEAAEVRDAAAKTDVVVIEGYHYLFHPVTKRLHDLIASGELGDLRRVETTMTIPAPPEEDPRWSLPLAGGAMMDLGCYTLHALRLLAPWAGGEPHLAGARGGQRAGKAGVDEWIDATLEFPDGTVGSARCDMAAKQRVMTMRVVGSRGEATAANFVLPQRDDRILVTTPAGTRVERLGTRPTYTYMLEAFVARLRHGMPLPIDTNDAVTTMQLIDACYRLAQFEPRPRFRPE
jgi:predicted dehydrogenase